jgi:hypothetical protein
MLTSAFDVEADRYDEWSESREGKAVFEIQKKCPRALAQTVSGLWLEVGHRQWPVRRHLGHLRRDRSVIENAGSGSTKGDSNRSRNGTPQVELCLARTAIQSGNMCPAATVFKRLPPAPFYLASPTCTKYLMPTSFSRGWSV